MKKSHRYPLKTDKFVLSSLPLVKDISAPDFDLHTRVWNWFEGQRPLKLRKTPTESSGRDIDKLYQVCGASRIGVLNNTAKEPWIWSLVGRCSFSD